MAFSVNK